MEFSARVLDISCKKSAILKENHGKKARDIPKLTRRPDKYLLLHPGNYQNYRSFFDDGIQKRLSVKSVYVRRI